MSTAPDPAPGGGPVSPAGLPSRKPLIVAAVGGVIVVVVAAVALLRDPPKGDDVVVDTAAVSVAADGRPLIPAYDTKEPLSIMQVELPATWIDVSSPQALRSLLTENAWLKGVTSSPLGRGFLGSWGAFFGSSNEDLGLSKLGQGLLGDMVAERLLTQPMRLTWFSGSSGTPALVVPKPSSALTSTVATLTATMQRGGFLLDQCPGEPAVTDDKQKLSIVRWIVADHTVFVAVGRDRLVVARNQDTAANALCSPLPEIKVDAGRDIVVGVAPARLGRDAQSLSAILGVGKELGLAFAIEGTSLKPVGLEGPLTHPERLGDTAIGKDTWKLVPEDMPVVVASTLELPASLSTAALQAFWAKGQTGGALKKREVLVLWQPHGDRRPTEVAVVWSELGDRAALQEILSGPNQLTVTEACGRLVASSTPGLLRRIEASCAGASPSLLFAQPAVVAGLGKPWSAGVIIDSSRLLQGLLLEGFADDGDRDAKKPVPAEIEAARKQLSELPRIGVVGTRTNAALKGWGFSS